MKKIESLYKCTKASELVNSWKREQEGNNYLTNFCICDFISLSNKFIKKSTSTCTIIKPIIEKFSKNNIKNSIFGKVLLLVGSRQIKTDKNTTKFTIWKYVSCFLDLKALPSPLKKKNVITIRFVKLPLICLKMWNF